MNKGFTLVELLAVIVILAVIALITIPAVMRIIDNSTTNSYRRSIDLYGKAVSQAVVSYESDMVEKGKGINVTFNNIEPYIEYEGNDVDCKDKTIYSDKTILLTECYVDKELVKAEKNKGYGDENYYYYTNSKKKAKLIKYIEAVEEEIKDKNISGTCNISEDKITCNSEDIKIKSKLENAIEGNLVIENNKVKSYSNLKFETEKKTETNNEVPQVIDEQNTGNNNDNNNNDDNSNQNNNAEPDKKICKSKNGTISTELGTEYECEVKDGTKYNFYILSKEGNNVNLIMDRNICEDGTIATESKKCLYSWYNMIVDNTSRSSNNYGPVTAMVKLYNATKNWNNVPNIIMDYHDENGAISDLSKGYTGIITDNKTKITKIISKEETNSNIGTSDYPLKARLAMRSEIQNVGCTTTSETCPIWLIDNLSDASLSLYTETSKINGIYGYWLLSSSQAKGNNNACNIKNNGSESYYLTNDTSKYGIRPVITMLVSNLSS